MKLSVDRDECYPYYWLYEHELWGNEIILSEEEFKDYARVQAAHDKWQDKLSNLYDTARKNKLLEDSKSGKQSLGFN